MNTQDTHSEDSVRLCTVCGAIYPHNMFHQCEAKPLSMDESEQELLAPFRAEIARLKAELEAARGVNGIVGMALLEQLRDENARLKAEVERLEVKLVEAVEDTEDAKRESESETRALQSALERAEAAEALAEKYRKLLVDSYLELRNESTACPSCCGWVADPDNPEWREWHEDGCELWAAVKDAMQDEEGKE